MLANCGISNMSTMRAFSICVHTQRWPSIFRKLARRFCQHLAEIVFIIVMWASGITRTTLDVSPKQVWRPPPSSGRRNSKTRLDDTRQHHKHRSFSIAGHCQLAWYPAAQFHIMGLKSAAMNEYVVFIIFDWAPISYVLILWQVGWLIPAFHMKHNLIY